MGTQIKRRGRTPTLKRKAVINFGKGLNTLVSDSLIDDQEASSLDNIEFVEAGGVTKRPGYTQVGDDLTNNPKGLGTFITESSRKLLTVDGTALKYNNSGTWTTISGATFDADAEKDFTQAGGNLYIFDGVSGGAEYDGTTLARPGTIPKAKFSIFYQGVHFCSGVTGQPNRVYVANTSDPGDFTDTGDDATSHPGATVFSGTNEAQFFDVQKDDGDFVTGFAKFQNLLVIFKENSIFQMTLDDTGTPVITPITNSLGCVSHKSIENVGNDVFFASRDGFFVLGNEPNFFTAIRTNELSARIHPDYDTLQESSYAKINSIYFDNKYWTGVPIGGSMITNTYAYDRRYLGWTKHSNLQPNSWTVFRDSSNVDHLYFACDNDTKVYEITPGTFSDDGSAISCTWVSKAFDMDEFSSRKRVAFVDLLFKQVSGQINITIYKEGGAVAANATINAASSGGMGTDVMGTVPLGETGAAASEASSQNVPYRVIVNANAKTVKVKLTNSRTNEYFILQAISIYYYDLTPYLFDSAQKLQ